MNSSNSSTPPPAVINLVTNFTWVAITYLGDTLFLLFILSGPLIKFARTRFAVQIIYSKCIATVLDLPISVVNMQLPCRQIQIPLTIVLRFHVLALALNRAHSVLAPFHYKNVTEGKYIANYCYVIWALGLTLGFGGIGAGYLQSDMTFGFAMQLKNWNNLVQAAAAALIYVLLAVKIVLCRQNSNSSAAPALQAWNQQVERDQMRIFMVCLISVIPFLLAYCSKYGIPFTDTPPDWLQSAWNIVGGIFDSLSFVAEEICLILLSADFRRIMLKHCLRMTCQGDKVVDSTVSIRHQTQIQNEHNHHRRSINISVANPSMTTRKSFAIPNMRY